MANYASELIKVWQRKNNLKADGIASWRKMLGIK